MKKGQGVLGQRSVDIYKLENDGLSTIAALLTSVSAGEPLEVSSEVTKINVTQLLAGRSTSVLLVRVNGESMAEDIRDGDWILIDRSIQPQPNDIVLAQLGDLFTVKRHKLNDCRGRSGLYLVPANDLYDTREIQPEDDFAIVGVVTWILKPTR